MAVQHIDKNRFKELISGDKPVLVDFSAPWCGYCRRIDPVYEKIAVQYADRLDAVKVNIDHEPALADAEQIEVVPTLILLLTAVNMLQASGAMEILSSFFAPVFRILGIPPETAILVLIRPISGSAALAIGTQLMTQYGVDSEIGRTVAVMLGSTETTFYTVSVYFGAAGIQKTRYTVPAALIADLTGFLMASLTTRLFSF